MAKLTKAEAARQLGIARSTLYKLIDQGKVSPTPDGLVDQAELVRVAAYVDTLKERLRASADTHDTPAYIQAEYTHGRPQTDDRGQPETDVRGRLHIPRESCHQFHGKVAINSTPKLPLIP